MTEKDLKEAAGKKLEEAYKLKSLEDGPSEETVAKWIAIADQRRAENRRRKKKILSCAAALALCICIGATCVVKTPNAVAGGSGGTKVEAGMRTSSTYSSYEDLPEEVKDEFILFNEVPDGYRLKEIQVEKNENLEKLCASYINDSSEEIYVRENKISGDSNASTVVNSDASVEQWGEITVYITKYTSGAKEATYRFIHEDLMVKIVVSESITTEQVKEMLENAVWN